MNVKLIIIHLFEKRDPDVIHTGFVNVSHILIQQQIKKRVGYVPTHCKMKLIRIQIFGFINSGCVQIRRS